LDIHAIWEVKITIDAGRGVVKLADVQDRVHRWLGLGIPDIADG
jgi:hypothetical protein